MKKVLRTIGALLLTTALVISLIPVSDVEASSTSDFQMDGNKLVKYVGTADVVSIPDDVLYIAEEAFAGKSLHNIFLGEQGYFTFKVLTPIERGAMRNAKNLAGEQSNSSFIVPGKFFFKLYRRIQAGTHPELEILKHLNDANFPNTPKICGTCSYKSDSGETYTLGILEELVSDSMDAWNYFNKEMDALKAQEMGIATAEFHNALKTLPGTEESGEEPPFDRLEELLASTEILI